MTTQLGSNPLCQQCGFDVWLPIARLTTTVLGLVDDSRYPGWCILALDAGRHFESVDELPHELAYSFLDDLRVAMKAIRFATQPTRLNVEFLGNRDPHLHAHIIPRSAERDPDPATPIWTDAREPTTLGTERSSALTAAIQRELPRFN